MQQASTHDIPAAAALESSPFLYRQKTHST
jgi:hypothetical protein